MSDAVEAMHRMVDSVNETHDRLRRKIDQQGKDLRTDLTGLREHLSQQLERLGEDIHRMDLATAEASLVASSAAGSWAAVLESMKEVGAQRERLRAVEMAQNTETRIREEHQKITEKWVKWLAGLNAATIALLLGAGAKMLLGL